MTPSQLRETKPVAMLSAEEMVSCRKLDASDGVVAAETAMPDRQPTWPCEEAMGEVPVAWVCEARAHPSLCMWLKDNEFMVDFKCSETMVMAGHHAREDEVHARSLLRSLKVKRPEWFYSTTNTCYKCYVVYSVCHSVLTSVLRGNKDKLAARRILNHESRAVQQANDSISEMITESRRTRKRAASTTSFTVATNELPTSCVFSPAQMKNLKNSGVW
mmetsp:Transcript_37789/g.92335  ORF Transcript_37789/g.92335 Transcript_37789/m.92335 type:complete len:217 (+) Transcript_37789:3-653(+)